MAPTIPIDFTGQRESKKFSISNSGLTHKMGKTRKVSKGYSTGFVPDYRHAVETVAESEGFGTASEDPSSLKRKCINLNMDGYDILGVPIRIFSLSKMSRFEKRDLEMKLKHELEQVRMSQWKIASMVVPVRKTCPPGRNGPRTKGVNMAYRRTESVKKVVPQSTNFLTLRKQCETLLTRLMTHQHGWIFNEPVDIVKHNIPDYFNVIKHPMDLGTIKRKLLSGQYSNPMGFAADVRLTFKNALTYNPPGHDVHIMAEIMRKYFETKWKPIEKKIPTTADESLAAKSSFIVEPESGYLPPIKKQKSTSVENQVKQERDKQGMSDLEKQKLGAELEGLMAELPDNIIDFLKENTLNETQISDDEIEIDIDTLSDDTLLTLRKLLDDYLLKKQKDQVKQLPCEIEIHNDSRFSNLSSQHCRDDDQDVDIGRDDPPAISSSIQVETDKNAVCRKCNSSSSSSSSSSAEHKESDDVPNAMSNSNTIEANRCQEGESGLPERQVSPEKLYRAALLRSRFADIIIKAQENNTIEKGEKPHLEKLKLEKEELENRRKEEKARLQAEAKVAEEARRKLEEEAAAEAKRKRELEREAARQALLQMEKTVDINENSQFMEDLEMLRSAPDEQLQSMIEEASPENSLNCLGSFKFPASSNPLEQLGLYIKNEEEEEEEEQVEPSDDREGDSD